VVGSVGRFALTIRIRAPRWPKHRRPSSAARQYCDQTTLIFSLGRPDVLPVDDLGFHNNVRRHYGFAEPSKPTELLALAEPWRPYRSFSIWYLWRSGSVEPRVADEAC
jgi:hypothetical protein